MCADVMHPDEVPTDAALVARLLAAQFPQWAGLPIEPVPSAGTDNALYRLGGKLVARLPRIHWAVGQVAKELRWLPRLAPLLPLEIPVPLAKGEPGEGYPWEWGVYPWLEGESATPERLGDAGRAAADLARFVAALQALDATDGPRPGAHNFHRGVPLALRDPYTREAIGKLHGVLDTGAATAAWEAALRARPWDGPPVWLHGDLQSGNLLAASGRLRAVIDFGGLGVGDPACDAMAAWTFLPRATRSVFRAALRVDDATWERARGWALSVGLVALAYYQRSNPVLAGISRRAIEEVLADHASAA
jgi:aminoglycoside phosphotransferase (APT) family kinase protein